MGQPAVFLDRDGTLVEPRHYPSRPEHLRLYPTLGPELRRLQRSGFRLVVVTNQSGLARGYFTAEELERMHAHLAGELARWDVRLDATYYCPHHPDGAVAALAVPCECRKPQPGMLVRAAEELDIDLRRSWLVGDILDDVEAGNRAGCAGVLVDLGTEACPERPLRWPAYVARDTAHALQIVGAVEGIGPPADLAYLPATWPSINRIRSPLSRRPERRTPLSVSSSGLQGGSMPGPTAVVAAGGGARDA